MRCAPAARRTALPDLPSPDCSLKFSGSFHITAPPLLVKPRPGEEDLSSPSLVCSRHSSPGLAHQHRLKISVQRDARFVVPAPAIIEGLVDRLILVVVSGGGLPHGVSDQRSRCSSLLLIPWASSIILMMCSSPPPFASFAAIRSGIHSVSKVLGHSDTSMTARYAHHMNEELKKTADQAAEEMARATM